MEENEIETTMKSCGCGNEHVGTHDVICNTFVTIVQNVAFHMWWEQPLAIVNSSHQQVDICVHQKWNSYLSWCCHSWLDACISTFSIF
jgi:hypothetical protein